MARHNITSIRFSNTISLQDLIVFAVIFFMSNIETSFRRIYLVSYARQMKFIVFLNLSTLILRTFKVQNIPYTALFSEAPSGPRLFYISRSSLTRLSLFVNAASQLQRLI